MHIHMFVQRVASDDNIADLPSRCDFTLLRELEAIEHLPVVHEAYMQPDAWKDLLLRWQL